MTEARGCARKLNHAVRAQTTRLRETPEAVPGSSDIGNAAIAFSDPPNWARSRRAWQSLRHAGGEHLAREDMIRADMQAVGTYNQIFEPTITQLAKTERELSRAEKEWKKQGGQRICTMINKTAVQYGLLAVYSAPVLLTIVQMRWPPCFFHSFSARESSRSVLASCLIVGSNIAL